MGPFDSGFFGLFGQIMEDIKRRMALNAFIINHPWMVAGEKDFAAYPELWGSYKLNVVGEHRGCSDEELERGDFYRTVGMYRMNRQNPELVIHDTCLEKDRL